MLIPWRVSLWLHLEKSKKSSTHWGRCIKPSVHNSTTFFRSRQIVVKFLPHTWQCCWFFTTDPFEEYAQVKFHPSPHKNEGKNTKYLAKITRKKMTRKLAANSLREPRFFCSPWTSKLPRDRCLLASCCVTTPEAMGSRENSCRCSCNQWTLHKIPPTFEGKKMYPPGNGYISHRNGKLGKSSTQNAILGGYVIVPRRVYFLRN